nr:391_t:CDS:2 [Entrophospora candida]
MNNRCDKISYKSTATPNVINMNSGVKMHYSPPLLVSSSSSERIIWKSLEKRQVQMYKTFADSVANLHTTRNPNYKYRPKRNRAAWKHGIPHFGQFGANDNHNYNNCVNDVYLYLNYEHSNDGINNIDDNSNNNFGSYVINYGYTPYYETPYTLRSNESNSNVGNKSTLFNENNNNNIEDNFIINTTVSNNLDYNLNVNATSSNIPQFIYLLSL